MTTTNGYLRSTRRRKRSERDNRVPRTELEESRRRNREFLRDRDETNTDEFEGERMVCGCPDDCRYERGFKWPD